MLDAYQRAGRLHPFPDGDQALDQVFAHVQLLGLETYSCRSHGTKSGGET